MPSFDELKRKIRQVVCCEPVNVDQNEGPPPPSTTALQAASISAERPQRQPQQQTASQPAQAAVDNRTGSTQEVQPEPIEEEEEEVWGDQELEPSPFKGEDFIIEKDEYDKYKYDKSDYKTFDDVQKAFEALYQSYKTNDVMDLDSIWNNREYESSIRNWDPDQEFKTTPTRAQAAAI